MGDRPSSTAGGARPGSTPGSARPGSTAGSGAAAAAALAAEMCGTGLQGACSELRRTGKGSSYIDIGKPVHYFSGTYTALVVTL